MARIAISKIACHLYSLNAGLRKGFLLKIHFHDGAVGYADCHPWPELGDAPHEEQLENVRRRLFSTPLLRRSLHFARLDAVYRGEGRHLLEGLTIPPSHRLVKGDVYRGGYSHAKIKVRQDNQEIVANWIGSLAERGIMIRLDFNHCLSEEQFCSFLETIAKHLSSIDFCEDPFPYDAVRWDTIQRQGITLARDRINSGESRASCVAKVGIWKPAVEEEIRGYERVVVTSYLDHPVGQVCAAYEAARAGITEVCGLNSHQVYAPSAFSECLWRIEGTGVGFDALLEQLAWRMM